MWSTIRDLWLFLRIRKKLWLTPIVIALVLLGTLVIFSSGSALAPLMYTVF